MNVKLLVSLCCVSFCFALPLQAQTLQWSKELVDTASDSGVWCHADGTGGCIVVSFDSRKVFWLSNKGTVKAEFTLPQGMVNGFPLMATSTRFYILWESGGQKNLRQYKLGSKGAVSFLDTPVAESEAAPFENFDYTTLKWEDSKGFFLALNEGTRIRIRRFAH